MKTCTLSVFWRALRYTAAHDGMRLDVRGNRFRLYEPWEPRRGSMKVIRSIDANAVLWKGDRERGNRARFRTAAKSAVGLLLCALTFGFVLLFSDELV